MASIDAVLFDYGLVLSGPPDPASWEAMKTLLQADEAAFHEAYWTFRHAYDRGDLTGRAYWHAVADKLDRTLEETTLATLLACDTALWTAPNHDMIAWAEALQKEGIRTGILSNIGDAMEEGILAHCPWLHAFAHHTFSHRLRMAKPEAAIYRHAAEGLGVAPEHILFVDDREENIAAARGVGMQAIQYADHDSFVQEMKQHGWEKLLSPTPKP